MTSETTGLPFVQDDLGNYSRVAADDQNQRDNNLKHGHDVPHVNLLMKPAEIILGGSAAKEAVVEPRIVSHAELRLEEHWRVHNDREDEDQEESYLYPSAREGCLPSAEV